MVKSWTSRSLLVVVASATALLIVAIDAMTNSPSISYVPYHSVGIGLRPSVICPFRCPWLTLRNGHAPGKTGYPLHAGLGKGESKGGEGRKASSVDSIDDLLTLASIAKYLKDMKTDIKNMATKIDIKTLATKADMGRMNSMVGILVERYNRAKVKEIHGLAFSKPCF